MPERRAKNEPTGPPAIPESREKLVAALLNHRPQRKKHSISLAWAFTRCFAGSGIWRAKQGLAAEFGGAFALVPKSY
jgi:hypothetical protein